MSAPNTLLGHRTPNKDMYMPAPFLYTIIKLSGKLAATSSFHNTTQHIEQKQIGPRCVRIEIYSISNSILLHHLHYASTNNKF